MAATRAQKIRLSVFLITVTVIVVATLLYLVGASLMQVRDHYTVVLNGGSGGLEVGSQVRFNDITVGRIESVTMDHNDPNQIIVGLSLDHGTPVTEDTVAVPEMANITGTKMLSMHGGTAHSKRLKPGDRIRAVESDFSMLTTKLVNISNRLETILDNLVQVTSPENINKLNTVLSDVEGITNKVNGLLDANEENINVLVTDARSTVSKVNQSMDRIENILASAETAIQRVASPGNVSKVTTILESANLLVKNVTARTSQQELGATIENINRLVADTNVTVLRLRGDLQRVMRELETSVENINEFTQMLIENPSVLINGRSEKERRLP